MGCAKLSIPTFVTPSILTASIFFSTNTNIVLGVIAILSSLVIPFVFTWILGFKDWNQEIDKEVVAPINGKIIPLEQMNDETFSKKLIGDGYAIIPANGKVVSPVNGVITTLFPTKHAIGITSDDGTEVLIHIGIDTVKTNGEGFHSQVQQGDHVNKNQELVVFDKQKLEKEGYDLTTAVVYTNGKKTKIEYNVQANAGKKVGVYA